MNIQLSDASASHISINMNDRYPAPTSKHAIHPDNQRTLFPHNPRNPYDRFCSLHNEAILYSYSKEQAGDDLETILGYVDEYLEHHAAEVPKLPKVRSTSKKGAPPFDDGSTIFWPPIPDELLARQFEDVVRKGRTFNPATDRYQELHRAYIVIEDDVIMRLTDNKPLAAQLLLICSAFRHSHALWLGVGQEIDSGVQASTTPITDADVGALTSAPGGWSPNRKLRAMARASRRAARQLRRAR